MSIRRERAYTICLSDDGGANEEIEILVPAGTRDEQDAAAEEIATSHADDWARDGDWGDDGACVTVYIDMEDDDYEWARRSIDVDIESNQDSLMRAAGADPDCDHDWTSQGEAGLKENPGVWSTGGTGLIIRDHCRHCGLRRKQRLLGSQRNHGEVDTTTYEMPE